MNLALRIIYQLRLVNCGERVGWQPSLMGLSEIHLRFAQSVLPPSHAMVPAARETALSCCR